MFENIVKNNENKFYKVSKSMIDEVQEDMGIILPKDLTDFYDEIGYGFLSSKRDYFNRIMDPGSVREFRFRKGQFENNAELEIYDEYERDKVVFFEICEGDYLLIGFSKDNNGRIFDGEEIIADNLEQFITKYQEDERYFRQGE